MPSGLKPTASINVRSAAWPLPSADASAPLLFGAFSASQTKIGELMQTCQTQADALANVPAVEAPALTPPPVMADAVAQPLAPAAPAAGEKLADQVKALQRVEFQRLREEGQNPAEFGLLALADLLAAEERKSSESDRAVNPYAVRKPHYAPRAKRLVCWR